MGEASISASAPLFSTRPGSLTRGAKLGIHRTTCPRPVIDHFDDFPIPSRVEMVISQRPMHRK
jgi:hypothetical protein